MMIRYSVTLQRGKEAFTVRTIAHNENHAKLKAQKECKNRLGQTVATEALALK